MAGELVTVADAPLAHGASDLSPVTVYLARLSPGSRRTMAAALESLARAMSLGHHGADSFPWHALRYQHTQALPQLLAENHLEPATINKYLAACKGVLRESWRLRQIGAEDYHLARDVATVRADTLPRGRALTHGEIAALFRACAAQGVIGRRNAALLAVLYGCGLRRAEASALTWADVGADSLTVRRGKGHKARRVFCPRGTLAALTVWRAHTSTAPALFVAVHKGGFRGERALSTSAIFNICQRLALLAGIDRFSPHDLRRTYCSHLLEAGADIHTVQRLAGHASVDVTARYDRRGDDALAHAADLLVVPV